MSQQILLLFSFILQLYLNHVCPICSLSFSLCLPLRSTSSSTSTPLLFRHHFSSSTPSMSAVVAAMNSVVFDDTLSSNLSCMISISLRLIPQMLNMFVQGFESYCNNSKLNWRSTASVEEGYGLRSFIIFISYTKA